MSRATLAPSYCPLDGARLPAPLVLAMKRVIPSTHDETRGVLVAVWVWVLIILLIVLALGGFGYSRR